MKKQHWLMLFILCLAAELIFIVTANDQLRYITKPLLMPLLFFYYLSSVGGGDGITKSIVAALFFSWIGDLLLMFDSANPMYFILGLTSFLIAHIFYIFFFHVIRIKENIKPKAFMLVPVVIFYAALMSMLSPGLGDLKLPVRIYGVVICFMLMLALHMLYLREKKTGVLMATGAILFVISDSILAINKFYSLFPGAALLVMFTYGVAQLLIVKGSIGYSNKLSQS